MSWSTPRSYDSYKGSLAVFCRGPWALSAKDVLQVYPLELDILKIYM